MSKHIPAVTLMRIARTEAAAIASGPFTPVVFERYEFIGGERGWNLGYPSETVCGYGCIVWDSKPSKPACEVAA